MQFSNPREKITEAKRRETAVKKEVWNGRQAFLDGATLDDNPHFYDEMSEHQYQLMAAWMKGWVMAEEEWLINGY